MAEFLDYVTNYFDDTMSVHGWIALLISAVGVVALNVGLMHLVRRPHEEFRAPDPVSPHDALPPPANDDRR